MFDIGLSELMMIMVVALVVIGPERLPKVARTLGHLWGRAQRYVNGIRADIERDMAIEEYRKLQQQVQEQATALEQSVKQAAESADRQVQQLNEVVGRNLPANSKPVAGQADSRQPPAPSPNSSDEKPE